MIWLRSTGLRILLALVLGFGLWLFVSYTENPDQRIVFEKVPVNIQGLTPGLIVVDKEGMPRSSLLPVDVTVQADEATIARVRSSDLQAYVDLSNLEPGEHTVATRVRVTRSGLSRLETMIEPDFIPIRLEQEITKTVPLEVEVTGSVPFSFEQGQPRVTLRSQPVSEARVFGPQGRVERVVKVRATADIDRLTANYNSPRPLEAIGANGEPIEGISIDPKTVDVQIPIRSSAGIKRVPVLPKVVGEPASGYVVVSVSVEPQFVSLTGSSGPLERVQNITTKDVSIEGATTTLSKTVALEEPPGARLRAGELITAVVQVRIMPIERPFQITLPIAVQAVGADGDLLLSWDPQVVQVTLAGTSAQLAQLNTASLRGVVNVQGRGVGTYTLQPSFQLPQGITVVNQPRVTVTIREPSEPPTPTLTSSPTHVPPTETAVLPTAQPTPSPTATHEPTAEQSGGWRPTNVQRRMREVLRWN